MSTATIGDGTWVSGMTTSEHRVRVVVGASVTDRSHQAVHNLLRAADLPVLVEVVCYGDGIDLVLDGPAASATAALQADGVRFLACANTLNGRGLSAAALLHGVGIVPAAVWHLARRQDEGWSYLPM